MDKVYEIISLGKIGRFRKSVCNNILRKFGVVFIDYINENPSTMSNKIIDIIEKLVKDKGMLVIAGTQLSRLADDGLHLFEVKY